MSFLHLFESEGPLLDVTGNLNKFDSAEPANTEGGDDAQVVQLQSLELLVDAEIRNIKIIITILFSNVLSIFKIRPESK